VWNELEGDTLMNLVKKQKIAKENQAVTTSRQIAEVFGKRHDHVLRDIENLITQNWGVKNMFIETTYRSRGRDYKQYLMNRDGYSLLAMGFTGARALEFKIQFITAFNLRILLEGEAKVMIWFLVLVSIGFSLDKLF